MKLRAENIEKSYRGKGLDDFFTKKVVVNKISLTLNQGEIVGLLGPNGAGKTTSFYMIVGLIKPDNGKIYIDNDEITDFPMYKRAQNGIGYLAQEASVFRKMSVEENILSVLQLTKLSKSDQKLKMESLLKEFGLTQIRKNRGDLLSGGERRRTEIARALATDPKFVLLDEPFAGVDPISIDDVRTLVAELKSQGIGVLITDHNVRDTLKIVDRAYILHDGRVIVSGMPEDVVNNDNVRRVYLGKDFNIQ